MIITNSGKKNKNGKWIQKMDMKEGSFTQQAKAAKKSVPEMIAAVKKDPAKFSKKTRMRATLANTFRKIAKKK